MRFFRAVPRVAPLRPSTLEAVAALYQRQWQGEAGGAVPDPAVAGQLTPDGGDLQAWLTGGFEVYEASLEGRVVGAVRLAFATGACVIDMLTVSPDSRRRGFGGYLVEHAVSRASRAGSLRAWATVPSGLVGATALLHAQGFSQYAEHRSQLTGGHYALFEQRL